MRKQFPWDIRTFLSEICQQLSSPNQLKKREIILSCNTSATMKKFLQDQFSVIDKMVKDYQIACRGRQCNLCFMTTHLHRYLTSKTFEKHSKDLFKMKKLDRMHNHICTDICFHILYKICNKEADHLMNDAFDAELSQEGKCYDIDGNLRCTLRYIGDAAIQSVCKKFRSNISRTHNHSIKKEIDYYSLRILSTLRTAQGKVEEESLHPESVMAVINKQGSKQCLTHVADKVLYFFEHLYVKCIRFLNRDMFEQFGDCILSRCIDYMHVHDTSINKWFDLFTDIPEMCTCNDPKSTMELDNDDTQSDNEDEFGDDSLQFQHSIILDLYQCVVTYFCRVQFADIRGQFVNKRRKKKQSLRAGLQSSSGTKFSAEDKAEKIPYPCAVCGKECKSLFEKFEEQSVQCSLCRIWLYFPCAGLKGDEEQLQEGNEEQEWLCASCVQNEEKDKLESVEATPSAQGVKRKFPEIDVKVKKAKFTNKRNKSNTDGNNNAHVEETDKCIVSVSSKGHVRKLNSKFL